MHRVVGRRRVLRAGLALGVAAIATPGRAACEFFTGNLTIVHPWTRATIAGDSAAIVCMTLQDVLQTDRLIGVVTPVAERCEMGGAGPGAPLDILVREGETTELTEAGIHIRLLGLKFPMPVGREYPLTLVFARFGAFEADLNVDYER